ncbi:MAG TPA: NAD(P)-dependent oxidoreductase [Armatimonadetes bacterium]|nr:NAD(P)-dependent oxidoreductase [Armatimonadota bacterium]
MAKVTTVLVTGATGSIGRDLCPRLAERFQVRSGVRRDVSDFQPPLPNPVYCNIRDFDSLLKAMEGVEAVVHLAAQSWENDVYEYMIPDNITGCYNVFEAARRVGVKRVVFASTNHVVGGYLKEGKPVTEDVPVRPDTIYAVTKVFGEALGRYYAEYHGLSVIAVRIGWFLHPEAEPLQKGHPAARHMWLSPRDCAQLMTRCLEAENITFAIVHGISNNARQLMLLERTKQLLGYAPEDDAERYVQQRE